MLHVPYKPYQATGLYFSADIDLFDLRQYRRGADDIPINIEDKCFKRARDLIPKFRNLRVVSFDFQMEPEYDLDGRDCRVD
jgi:hypothetical protein